MHQNYQYLLAFIRSRGDFSLEKKKNCMNSSFNEQNSKLNYPFEMKFRRQPIAPK